jgi:hypothetical protein
VRNVYLTMQFGIRELPGWKVNVPAKLPMTAIADLQIASDDSFAKPFALGKNNVRISSPGRHVLAVENLEVKAEINRFGFRWLVRFNKVPVCGSFFECQFPIVEANSDLSEPTPNNAEHETEDHSAKRRDRGDNLLLDVRRKAIECVQHREESVFDFSRVCDAWGPIFHNRCQVMSRVAPASRELLGSGRIRPDSLNQSPGRPNCSLRSARHAR